jgi:tRNA nucleotidyltransferase (CCA-adding enzyme)
MKYKVSCGVIPAYIEKNGDVRFLLVQGHGDYWGFPKGHKEKGETDRQTAERELYEETRVCCSQYIKDAQFIERYRIRKKQGTDIIKKVIYFIGISSSKNVVRQTAELKKHGWFSLEEAQKKLLDNRKTIIQNAYTVIKNSF